MSVTSKLPLRKRRPVGLNVIEIEHDAPAAKVVGRVPQVFVSEKFPVVAMEARFSTAVPVLLSVMIWAELVVPTC